MKFKIKTEFTEEEIRRFATDLIIKGVGQGLRTVGPGGIGSMVDYFRQQIRVAESPPSCGFGNRSTPPVGARPPRTDAIVDQCFPIEESRSNEAGVACCKCATFNDLRRSACRECGHEFCHSDSDKEEGVQ